MHNYARTNTTEAQVARSSPSDIDMRDNRVVGVVLWLLQKTWVKHGQNMNLLAKALPESPRFAWLV